MISEPGPRTQWASLEAQIARLRSGLSEGGFDLEVANELEANLGCLDRHLWPIFENAISEVQVTSKLWLLDELFACLPSQGFHILVLGGWCGVLPWLAKLTGQGSTSTWVSIDVDSETSLIGRSVFSGSVPNVCFQCQDIHSIDYQRLAKERNLIVINTICEHLPGIADWRRLIPSGTLTILQSNNFRGCPDHVNCVDSVEELIEGAKLGQVIYRGSLILSLFTRFMVIGRA
jgi:hypothetical protein